jgi:multidrug efflux pump subunit AcrB
MGKFIAVMPTAVICILTFSLFEALIILPAHLNHALARTRRHVEAVKGWHARLRVKIERTLQCVINDFYTPALNYVVRNRYFAFSIGIGVLIISLGIIRGGYVPFIFMPKGESDWIIAEVYYPLGTPIELTSTAITRMEESSFELEDLFKDRQIEGERLVTNTYAMVGKIPRRDWKPTVFGGHCGEVWIELTPSANRPQISVNEVIQQWRKRVGEVPGVEQLSFFTIEGGPAGSPIEIQLVGADFQQLRLAADELKTELATYPGTYDVTDNFKPGKEEKQFEILPGARSVGVTMLDLARQLRQAFYGEEAVRIQRGRDDLKVMVRYAERERRSLAGIENMRIRTADGRQIPIEEVAAIKTGRAWSTVRRVDRNRVITVSSDLDEDVGNASRIVASLRSDFLPALKARYPGLTYDLEGQEKRTQESLDSLKKGFMLAMMGVFLLLASQFRSYIQPVIIMMAIPFGLIGAIGGHLVMGLPFTMISIFGIVALSGIVVNDSLILIDFINRAGRSGIEIQKAVVASGIARFRPVLLTSLTTIAGLFPLLLERSFQAQFLIPMAVSISFGLLVATVLTLLYVPALYLIVGDIVNLATGKLRKVEDPKTSA